MDKIILAGACVITDVARGVGEFVDIVVDGSRIVELRPSLADRAGDHAKVIDFTGRIIMPGQVNAHMHSWQTPMRGLATDWQLMEYLMWMHGRVMPVLTPDDIYIATLAGAINQINCGTATLADWCHANRTPEHSDAGVAALIECGIRAVFFHGTPHGQAGQRQSAWGSWMRRLAIVQIAGMDTVLLNQINLEQMDFYSVRADPGAKDIVRDIRAGFVDSQDCGVLWMTDFRAT